MLFLFYAIVNGVVLAFIQGYCELQTASLICIIVGVLLEYAIHSNTEGGGDWWLNEIAYFAAILLQIIPLIIESFGFLERPIKYQHTPKAEINLVMSIAVGVIALNQWVLFFLYGFKGDEGIFWKYISILIVIVIELILAAIIGNEHTTLVVNIVLGFVSIVGIAVSRVLMGSNLA